MACHRWLHKGQDASICKIICAQKKKHCPTRNSFNSILQEQVTVVLIVPSQELREALSPNMVSKVQDLDKSNKIQ